jgi:hypothetical protein
VNKVGRLSGWVFVGSLTLAVAACGGSDNDEESSELGGGATPGCRAWQTAICDWIEACGGVVTGCREQVVMTVCQSDTEADACATKLPDSGCSAPPTGCDLWSVVDTAPATAACESFIETWCDYSERCEPGSRELCVSESESAFNCSRALGVGESFDECLSEVAALECSSAVPEPCLGVLLLPT